MAVIGALIYKFQADIADLVKNTGEIVARLDSVSTTANRVGAMLGRSFSVAAIGLAAKQTAAYADDLDEMAQGIGVSVEWFQRASFAARQNGADMDKLARGVQNLAERLDGGDKSVVDALGRLGLSLDAVKALGMEGAFEAIARALSQVTDPTVRGTIQTDLFAKSGKALATLFRQDLPAAMANAPAMTEATIKAMGAANDSFDALIISGKTLIGSVLAPAAPAFNYLAAAASYTSGRLIDLKGNVAALGVEMAHNASIQIPAWMRGDQYSPYANRVENGPDLPESPRRNIATGLPLPSMADADRDTKILEARAFDAAHAAGVLEWKQKLEQEALKDLIPLWDDRNTLQADYVKWTQALNPIRAQQIELLQRENIAVWDQIKAWNTLHDLDEKGNQLSTDPYDKQLRALGQQRDQDIRSAEASGAAPTLVQQRIDQILTDFSDQSFQLWDKFFGTGAQAATQFAASLDQASAATSRWTASAGAPAPGLSQSGGGPSGAGLGWAPGGRGTSSAPLSYPSTTFWMGHQEPGYGYTPSWSATGVPHFGSGGYADRPTLAVVGDSPGGEYMVPAGKMGGPTIVVHVDARESSFDTPASMSRLGDRVAQAIDAKLRARGFRV